MRIKNIRDKIVNDSDIKKLTTSHKLFSLDKRQIRYPSKLAKTRRFYFTIKNNSGTAG